MSTETNEVTQEQRSGAAGFPPEAVLTPLLFGALIQQGVRVVAKLGIADLLAERPRSVSELAVETETHEPSLYRLLRTLAGAGVFAERAERTFALTPVGALLRRDVPNSMRDFAIMQGEDWNWRGTGEMWHSVKTGETAQAKVHGMELFEYLKRNPDSEALFSRAMTSYSLAAVPAIVEAYDFSRVASVADIGGGHGTLLAGILRANPRARGVLFDVPSVVDGADELLERAGVRHRVDVVSGDFFASVPPGADAYVLKNVIHDWSDERSLTILRNVHAAMRAGGRVVLVELVVPEGNEPSPAKLVDLQMLVTTGGKERTGPEYAQLLVNSGFRLARIVPTRSPMSVIEGEWVEAGPSAQ